MKVWTAHVAHDQPPVLIPEGFSWSAYVFGPFWLAACGAWTMAGLVLAADVALAALAPGWTLWIAAFATGLFGQDLRRLSLYLGGAYSQDHVIAATSEDGALVRLLARRPDLIAVATQ